MFRGELYCRVLRDNRGATAIEYGLIVALIVIAIMVSLSSLSDSGNGLWAVVKDKVVFATT
ncbi:Flp family type IVb pilin [Croceibacterium sp. LX-88]|uniref:Flp family type IVb pilin n=1 Tax=Croceibacterium selenioxidans TaxID=2838833 RepID=A0ABS5W2S4_9SPHN|nr:Flp family type IVb pilin [Croceibacterium selenioxidans]